MRLESANWIKRTASHKGSNANDNTEQELDWELLTSSCFHLEEEEKARAKKNVSEANSKPTIGSVDELVGRHFEPLHHSTVHL